LFLLLQLPLRVLVGIGRVIRFQFGRGLEHCVLGHEVHLVPVPALRLVLLGRDVALAVAWGVVVANEGG